jgi:hypothetical protein
MRNFLKATKKVLLLSVLATVNSLAAEPVEEAPPLCEEVLSSCGQALIEQDLLIGALDDELKLYKIQAEIVLKDNEKLRDRTSRWYRNPLTMLLIGAILGGITLGSAK